MTAGHVQTALCGNDGESGGHADGDIFSEQVTAVLSPGYIYKEFIHEKICFVLQVL